MDDLNENSNTPYNKKFVIAGLFLTVVIMFLATITFIISRSSNITPDPITDGTGRTSFGSPVPTSSTSSNNANPAANITVQPTPRIEVKEWVQGPKPAVIPPIGKIYSFKQNFTYAEVNTFVSRLFTPSSIKEDKTIVMATNTGKTQLEAFTFNKITGIFSFITSKGVPLTETDKPAAVYAFLKKIGWYDETILATAQYKKKSRPNVTFVELHRDWSKIGMPVLNLIGLMNLPENQTLTNLSLSSVSSNIPQDTDIYSTTDNKNGLARQTDFNTITVAIREKDNSIVSVSSTMRKLQEDQSVQSDLITYEDAQLKLKNNEFDYFVTDPSGGGSVPWDKVYKDDLGVAEKGVITEARYAYIEKTPTAAQTQLVPYIIFRGYAQLDTGYRTNFYGAIPARKTATLASTKVLGARTTNKLLAQVTTPTQAAAPGQYMIDNPSPTGGTQPTVAPTLPGGVQNVTVTPIQGCYPPFETYRFSPIISVDGITVGRSSIRVYYRDKITNERSNVTFFDESNTGATYWYYIPADKQVTEGKFREDYLRLRDLGPTMQAQDPAFDWRDFYYENDYWAIYDFGDNASFGYNGCPIRISGGSPSVFVYGAPEQKLDISSKALLTYMDPPISNGKWSISINQDKTLSINGVNRDYLYYEYKPVAFNKPPNGWVIKKTELSRLSEKIAIALQLKNTEKQRLEFEINHAANSIVSEYIFVGNVDQNEVESKVPLIISPRPENVQRYHFYVGAASKDDESNDPSLKPLQRSSYMLLEFGSYAAK